MSASGTPYAHESAQTGAATAPATLSLQGAVKEAAEWSVAKDLAAAMGIVEEPDGEALQATAVALATAAEEALAAAQAAQEAADAKLLEEAEAAEAAKAEAEAEAEAEAKAAKDTQNKAAKTTRQKGGTT